MNVELKTIIDILLDLYLAADDAVGKNFAAMGTAVFQALEEMPNLISGIADLKTELAALPGSTQESDLISYVESKVSSVAGNSAQTVLSTILGIIQNVVQVVEQIIAFKNLL